jgi:mRNA-degrading endonuclease HigB of HigAB toxin-antitoxin module
MMPSQPCKLRCWHQSPDNHFLNFPANPLILPSALILLNRFGVLGNMKRQVEHLDELQVAIRLKYYCEPSHRKSVFVHEKAGLGETAWKGYVEVFDLTGHAEAKTCYAWVNRQPTGLQIVTVLGNHFIDSAQKAVRSAIFVDAQLAFSSNFGPSAKLYMDELQVAIRQNYFSEPVHKKSVFVHEKTEIGETAWRGYVEVFDLSGHEKAQTCYAWVNRRGYSVKIITVLGNHLVDSADKAVQAAIFMDGELASTSDVGLFDTLLQQAKKTLHETKIKSEDLEAAIEAARQVKEKINNRKTIT